MSVALWAAASVSKEKRECARCGESYPVRDFLREHPRSTFNVVAYCSGCRLDMDLAGSMSSDDHAQERESSAPSMWHLRP